MSVPPFTGVVLQAAEVLTPDEEDVLEPAGIEKSDTTTELAARPISTLGIRWRRTPRAWLGLRNISPPTCPAREDADQPRQPSCESLPSRLFGRAYVATLLNASRTSD